MSKKTGSSKFCCIDKAPTRTRPLFEMYLGPYQASMMKFFEKQSTAESY